MMAKKLFHSPRRQTVFEARLARFVANRRSKPRPRVRGLHKLPLFGRLAARRGVALLDPVSLAIFAIDRVGPAAVRACASGVEVCIAAPDEATAAVFRAALSETAQRRGTDRLIRIVVEAPDGTVRSGGGRVAP
jgi:hypothetical protein